MIVAMDDDDDGSDHDSVDNDRWGWSSITAASFPLGWSIVAVVVVLVDDSTALHDGRQIDIDVLVGGPIACSDNDGGNRDDNGDDDDDRSGNDNDDVDDDDSNVLPVVSVCTENSILP